MKRSLFFSLFGFLLLVFSGFRPVDKSAFYKVLASGEEGRIDEMLAEMGQESPSSLTNAYIGTLTMKKAGFLKGVGNKVKTFKKGAQMLEDEISSSPDNTEYRFLRLTVQENAPGILKYNKELDEDKAAIINGFDKLDRGLKTIIKNYAKDSKILTVADLK